MSSIQELLGHDEKFFNFLEASAQQADSSVHHLVALRRLTLPVADANQLRFDAGSSRILRRCLPALDTQALRRRDSLE